MTNLEKAESMLNTLVESNPDHAERLLESMLAKIELRKRLATKQALAEPVQRKPATGAAPCAPSPSFQMNERDDLPRTLYVLLNENGIPQHCAAWRGAAQHYMDSLIQVGDPPHSMGLWEVHEYVLEQQAEPVRPRCGFVLVRACLDTRAASGFRFAIVDAIDDNNLDALAQQPEPVQARAEAMQQMVASSERAGLYELTAEPVQRESGT